MELCIYLVAVLAFALAVEADSTETSSQLPDDVNESYNPLADLVLNQNQTDTQPLSRVKRQYGYGPYRRYPYPLPIFVGLGGIGVGGYRGFGGRGFGRGGGRGVAFGGRGFGGRGPSIAGRGIGGRGIGGRGIGGRGGGIGGGRGGGRG